MVYENPLSRKKLFIIMSLITFLMLSSCSNHLGNPDKADEIKPVHIARVQRGTIQNVVSYSGLVKAHEEAYIISALPGKISNASFDIGDRVQKGDLLFTIESDEIENSLQVLEEQLVAAQANVSLAEKGVVAAWGSQYKSQMLQLESALKAAENQYVSVKSLYDDYSHFYQAGKITKAQYFEVKTQLQQATLSLDSAREAYELYVDHLSKETASTADAMLTQAMASRDVIKLQITSAQKKLELTRVTSPISGYIATKNVSEGVMIPAGHMAYTVLDQDPVLVLVSVTEQVINSISKGDSVSVEIPSAGEKSFRGKITFTSPSVDEKTRAYLIGIEIGNADMRIKPGMTANVGLRTDIHENTLIIPTATLLTGEGETYVFTVKDGKAYKKVIQCGLSNGSQTEVLDGLSENDVLVSKGQQYLRDQDSVKAVREGDKR